ncbi:MAG TPA: hypothetical protein PL029_09050 [Bacteroidia bacterium]|nr:hypothetical protein [Bacteroidia bacterium]
MKKLLLLAAFAGLLGSSAVAGTNGDDKGKKAKKECKAGDAKACAGEKKEGCAKGEKSCCKKKAEGTAAATPADNKVTAEKK